MNMITIDRSIVQQALEALEDLRVWRAKQSMAVTTLRAALAQQENKTPITDDHGKALLPQYQVIEQSGNWVLLYDQKQSGEARRHEFRIQKLRHDVALYPGITLAEAQKRFRERVEADNE